ncbi:MULTISPECIES: hypothetical protein [Deinococcus]|uniref:Uncharacterized protein n=2 Tax=Deinococcus TaxID=1298 RepID=H8H3G6_DEIGI|nr:hypothetical protein [Deinococcus gobiensis]AFD28063.1 hypothetical protein DGo_PC0271 [Deinococcus gobiensis I-0]
MNTLPQASRPPLPIQVLTPRQRESTAKLEYTAHPGSLLGGAFACAPRQGCQLIPRAQLAETHLAYLRAGYKDQTSPLRQELDRLAHTYRYGHNSLAIYAHEEIVAQNVIHAIQGIAAKLPAREDA